MRLSIVRDGKPESTSVDTAASTVHVGDHTYPYKLVAESPDRVELEIGGERAVVEGWPKGLSSPPGPVDVNGERWRVTDVRAETTPGSGPMVAPTERAVASPLPSASTHKERGSTGEGEGTGVVPPMPGKIIDVRVREGDHVEKGQVLLVLEAMKMRNEIPSPVAGKVLHVGVSAGSNVRAREAMIRIAPD